MEVKTLLLYDYPESFLKKKWILLKIFIKEGLFGKKWSVFFQNRTVGGSLVIPQSLVQGLRENKFALAINNYTTQNNNVVVVLKNCAALNWAIEQKKQGRIQKLIAGPFIATFPHENRKILSSSEIDGLLFLSDWHRNLFLRHFKGPAPRDYLWFSGVDTQYWQPTNQPKNKILI